jgi:hypothetical protein
MTSRPQLDYFDSGFADRDNRGVRFITDAESLLLLLRSAMAERVTRIARLPYLNGPVTLYPDASSKPFGFPAGIVVRTTGDYAYPMAAPDMGCGYLVVDTGIDVGESVFGSQVATAAFDELVEAVDVDSSARKSVSSSVVDIMTEGVSAVGAPEHFSVVENPAEESNSWEPNLTALDRDFVSSALQSTLGSAAGHFVACYVVDKQLSGTAPTPGRLIAVVHIGSAPIRDHLNSAAFYARLAETAIDTGVSSVQDTADGLFAVDLRTNEGRAFIGTAMAARNFGYANRQIVADKVTEILRRRLAPHVTADAKQLRHVDHVAFEAVSGGVRSRRGLQPLRADHPVFITGGEYAHGYLADTGANSAIGDDLCCHGSPVRDADAFPVSIWRDGDQGVNPNAVRDWALTMAANTEFETARFWSDVSNLELVMAYLRRADVIRPTAVLRQFMNYREVHL